MGHAPPTGNFLLAPTLAVRHNRRQIAAPPYTTLQEKYPTAIMRGNQYVGDDQNLDKIVGNNRCELVKIMVCCID